MHVTCQFITVKTNYCLHVLTKPRPVSLNIKRNPAWLNGFELLGRTDLKEWFFILEGKAPCNSITWDVEVQDFLTLLLLLLDIDMVAGVC